MSGTAEFLQQLIKLYTAFGVLIKNTPALILSLTHALVQVDSLTQYLKSTVNDVKDAQNIAKSTNGPQGIVAAKTIKSISMLLSEMENLNQVEEVVNYPLNFSTCFNHFCREPA